MNFVLMLKEALDYTDGGKTQIIRNPNTLMAGGHTGRDAMTSHVAKMLEAKRNIMPYYPSGKPGYNAVQGVANMNRAGVGQFSPEYSKNIDWMKGNPSRQIEGVDDYFARGKKEFNASLANRGPKATGGKSWVGKNPMESMAKNLSSKMSNPGSLIGGGLGLLGSTALGAFGRAANNAKDISSSDQPGLFGLEKRLREKGGVLGAAASIPVSLGAGFKAMGKSKGYVPGAGRQAVRIMDNRARGTQPKATSMSNPNSKFVDYSSGAQKSSLGGRPGAPAPRAQKFIANKSFGGKKPKTPSWLKYKPVSPKLPDYNKHNIPKQPGFSFGAK